MKSVSILGCGWLGKPLGISLLKQGYSVKGSTTSELKLSELDELGINSYLINIEDCEEHHLFLQSEIVIIAITSKDIEAFKHLTRQIEFWNVQKVIFISSTSVYPNTNAIVTEDSETVQKPLTEIEDIFRKNHHFKSTILRFAGLYGPDRHPGNWFKGGRMIPQPEGFVNMIHQEDCIQIIEEVIAKDCWNTTLNACSNHHPTRREFYTKAKESLGYDEPVFEETDESSYKIISSKKLQRVLGYTFIHDDLLSFS
ncbi:dTDP-glucose 4,6-dehydratase [Pseudotenacibaculum haliotis]|uniref:dTDP-glucose 4,6-dehydratase n=1 Tax=Pseudotenacibaculum haliotis TaxID=1862138 RepID=A0ABW5LW77_9FLAO